MTESALQDEQLEDDEIVGNDAHDLDDGDNDDGDDAEIEARARRQGWVPEDEWDDDRAEAEGRKKPKQFVTAREFLDRVESSAPMMRERLRKSDEERAELARKSAELQERLDEVTKLVKWQVSQAKTSRERAYQQGIKDAEARMKQAVSEADTEAFEEAKADHERLTEEMKSDPGPEVEEKEPDGGKEKTDPPKKGQTDPETQAWLDKNPWFHKDPELNGAMIKRHTKVLNEMPGLSITEALEEAKRRVVEKFPEEFGINPRRQAPGAVSHPSGDRRSSNGVQERFNKLPREDKEAYERHKRMFAERNEEYTVAQFMEDYDS